MLGAASIRGVPAFGLPKISSLVGGISVPPLRLLRCGRSGQTASLLWLAECLEFIYRFVHGVPARNGHDSLLLLDGCGCRRSDREQNKS